MKKLYVILGCAAFALVFTASAVKAQDEGSDDANVSVTAQAHGPTGGQQDAPGSIGARMRADIQARNTNVKNNEDVRNNRLENRTGMMASTSTSTAPGDMPGRGRGEGNDNGRGNDRGNGIGNGMMNGRNDDEGSTTDQGDQNETTHGMGRARADIFNKQKSHLIQELNRALQNLIQIRGRISQRITTAEASGRDMSTAKSLLVVADAKIAAAQTAINALAGLSAQASTTSSGGVTASSTASTTVTVTVDLGKPRQVGAAAIQAVKDAQRALNAVVVAIAHSMGFRIGIDGTIQASTTATTTTGTGNNTGTGTTTSTTTVTVGGGNNTGTSTATTTATTTP